jgi:hypothetical protein
MFLDIFYKGFSILTRFISLKKYLRQGSNLVISQLLAYRDLFNSGIELSIIDLVYSQFFAR